MTQNLKSKIKELATNTLENKWRSMLEEIEECSLDLSNIADVIGEHCSFCYNAGHKCSRCIIDKRLCNLPSRYSLYQEESTGFVQLITDLYSMEEYEKAVKLTIKCLEDLAENGELTSETAAELEAEMRGEGKIAIF